MKKERLDKILASQNFGSRKEVGAAIRGGRVSIGGKTVLKPDFKMDPESGAIAVDGNEIVFKRRLYLMMNKPAGVLSASRDTRARTVVDLLPEPYRRRGIFPAGRLDRDTEGLLILTDDGLFAHRMLSPRSHVKKWYEARLAAPVTEEDRAAFRAGIQLSDWTCLPAELQVLEEGQSPVVCVRICEGKYHQVKRMFAARGNQVLRLRRVRIGGLSLDPELVSGKTREMSPEECRRIFHNEP
jgi:16S rRNA pseudouridine516 synthase